MKIGIVVSEFNGEITESLYEGARAALKENKIEDGQIETMRVPGAFEIPLAAKFLISKKGVQGVVALGAVIRGETSHYDYVCQAAERGCTTVSLECLKPVGFGVLTTENDEQAWARAKRDKTNKGYETSLAVLKMIKNML